MDEYEVEIVPAPQPNAPAVYALGRLIPAIPGPLRPLILLEIITMASRFTVINRAYFTRQSPEIPPLREISFIEQCPPTIKTMCYVRGGISFLFYSQIKAELEHVWGRRITIALVGYLCEEMKQYNVSNYVKTQIFILWIYGGFLGCPMIEGQRFERKLVSGSDNDMDE